jgi:hypothetical protein
MSKYLGVVIRYFSETKGTVVSTFLGLVELDGGDAHSIARALLAFLEKCSLVNLLSPRPISQASCPK